MRIQSLLNSMFYAGFSRLKCIRRAITCKYFRRDDCKAYRVSIWAAKAVESTRTIARLQHAFSLSILPLKNAPTGRVSDGLRPGPFASGGDLRGRVCAIFLWPSRPLGSGCHGPWPLLPFSSFGSSVSKKLCRLKIGLATTEGAKQPRER